MEKIKTSTAQRQSITSINKESIPRCDIRWKYCKDEWDNFFIATFHNSIFCSGEHIKNHKAPTILHTIKNIKDVYAQRGFIIPMINMDGKVENLQNNMSLLGIYINIVSRNEHVFKIERSNRMVKERTCATVQTLPFQKFPRRMIIEILYTMLFWLNGFTVKNGISKVMNSCTIITGQMIDYNNHCNVECG